MKLLGAKQFNILLVLAGMTASGGAAAHAGDHAFSGLMHFLSEPDHADVLVLAGVIGALILKKLKAHKSDRNVHQGKIK